MSFFCLYYGTEGVLCFTYPKIKQKQITLNRVEFNKLRYINGEN